MILIKVLVAVLLVAFTTFLGYFLAGKYRVRKRYFAEFSRFNERYLAELSYERRQLMRFLQEETYEGEFGKAVEKFCKERTVSFDLPFLAAEERTDRENYFRRLGRGDAHTQTAFYAAQSKRLEELKLQSEREAKARTELYLKLGLLAGLALVVLII